MQNNIMPVAIDKQNIQDTQVMIGRDLVELCAVGTKRLNEQVKRNIERFLEKFRFQFIGLKRDELVANCNCFHTLKHFTSHCLMCLLKQGVSMFLVVLKSKIAIGVSIKIIDLFVNMRRFISGNALLLGRNY